MRHGADRLEPPVRSRLCVVRPAHWYTPGVPPSTWSLDPARLRCSPLLAQNGTATTATDEIGSARFGATELRVVSAAGVLYLPELRLQVMGDDLVPVEAMEDPWNLEFRVANGFDGQAARYREARQVSGSDLDVCVLANWTSRNFMHWVTEEMPKVMVAEAAGFSGHYVVDTEPGFPRQLLHMVGIDETRIVAQPSGPTRYRSAIFLPTLSGRVNSVGDVYLTLRRWLQEASGATVDAPRRRIWMERTHGSANGRTGIVNQPEIDEVLSWHDVERVDLATLPVKEQIALSSSAELLMGPHGAAFAHVLFQPHESDVVECFSPAFINAYVVLDLCVLMRHRYRMVVHNNAYGAYPYGDDLRVDCTQLELALDAIGQAKDPVRRFH